MSDAFELLTHQRRRRELVPGGTTRTTLLEQLARTPTDEPLVTMLMLELEPGAARLGTRSARPRARRRRHRRRAAVMSRASTVGRCHRR